MEAIGAAADAADLTERLHAFAREHVTTVTQPHIVALRRTVVAEAGRAPELARRWHAAAPERGHVALAAQIRRLDRAGLLAAPDPLLAAELLNHLILSTSLDEALFGVRDTFPPRLLRRRADEAVRVFLAAYGT